MNSLLRRKEDNIHLFNIIAVDKYEPAYKKGWKYKRLVNKKWKYYRNIQKARI